MVLSVKLSNGCYVIFSIIAIVESYQKGRIEGTLWEDSHVFLKRVDLGFESREDGSSCPLHCQRRRLNCASISHGVYPGIFLGLLVLRNLFLYI